MALINWDIAKHPLNWVIVLLMVLIAGFAVELAIKSYKNARTTVADQNTATAG